MLRFGTDGVRGVALTEVTTEYVAALGAAAAIALGSGSWLVGRDTRESGLVLEDAFVAGLRSQGASVVSCGVVPTPALAYLSQVDNVPAAMITASHNPYTDNGVKIFAAGGVKLTDQIERKIESLIDLSAPNLGTAASVDTTGLERYRNHLIDLFPPASLSGLHVVLDCANGAMSVVAGSVVRDLGAQVTILHAEPNGTNINDHCGATHPASLCAAVLAHHADVGLAFDGDGDRLIAVDNQAAVIDGDRLIGLAALHLKDQGLLSADTVVVTQMSNLGFHQAMAQAGVKVVATAVGDRYVLEALSEGDFALGGEQSGHIIYRHLATTGDGLLAGLQLLVYLQDKQRPLSELANGVMTTFPQVLRNVRVRDRHPNIAQEVAAEIAAAEAAFEGNGRVLVRASGTEPLIRVMVEAPTPELAEQAALQLCAVVEARFAAKS